MSHVDGNSLAGPLSDLFSIDITDAVGRCVGCGDEAVLARAMVYVSGTDLVVRCSNCDDVLLTVVHGPGDLRLTLAGLDALRVAV
jgi:ribosomal protein S27E